MYDWSLAGKRVYQRYAVGTQFAVDDLYKDPQRTFSAQTVDGETLEFVELKKSSTGIKYVITQNDYDQAKVKNQ